MAEWTVLPASILQRLGSEPAMLAVLMAGGVGATAIAASNQGAEEPAPAAESTQAAALPETEVPPQPVLLDNAPAPAGLLAVPDGGPAVSIGKADESAAATPAVAKVVSEPVQANVLGPYVPLPAAEPQQAEAPVVEEPAQVAAAPLAEPQVAASELPAQVTSVVPAQAAVAEVVQQAPDEGTPDIAAEPEAPAPVELAQDEGAPAAELPALAAAEPAPAKPSDRPAEAEPAALELAAESAPPSEPAPAMAELVAEPAASELAVETVADLDPVAEVAQQMPERAAEPAEGRNAFNLAFADLASPSLAEPVQPVMEPVAEVAAPAPQLAPTPAPALAIASVAFDLAALPVAAEPGSAFVRRDGAASAAPAARSHELAVPGSRYRLTGNGIEFRMPAMLFGEELGTLPLRIGSTNLVSVRLGDLLALVADHMDPVAHARLTGSRSADEYVSFSTLRDAGIELRYDAAHDRLILGE